MLNQLVPIMPASGASTAVRPELRSPGGESRPAAMQVQAQAVGHAPDGTVGGSLDQLVEQAARDLFPGREVAVESFYDEASGRYVHRIADSASGELLLQTPPDELLRFFASGREPYGAPLLEIDA
jgi:hypothetical protein